MKISHLSTFIIITGLILTVSSSLLYIYKNHTPPRQPQTDFMTYEDDAPIRLTIQSVGIDIPVKEDENYQNSDSQAIFVNTSQALGTGNSVIYAHNWQNLFGKLNKVKMGDNIIVYLANGRQVAYRASQMHTVSPQTLSILKSTADSRLTLFTCTGFLDKDRLVVVAVQT